MMVEKFRKITPVIDELILEGNIKDSWSEVERYGIGTMLEALFEEELDYRSLATTTIMNKGVVAEYLYDGIPYNGYNFTLAYITIEGDVILTAENDSIIYFLKTDKTSSEEFNTDLSIEKCLG